MRAFISIELPKELQRSIYSFARELKAKELFSGTFPKPENYHLTLKFLGEIDEPKVSAVKKLLQNLNFEKFEISFKGIGCFPTKQYIRVIWVGVDLGHSEIIKLYNKLDEKLAKIGFKKDKHFEPHLTIARVKFCKNKKALQEAISKSEDKEFGSFIVDKIFLIKSTLTPNGAIYEKLAEQGI